MEIENLVCFRCRKPGHIAADCDYLKPATTYAEHMARIDRFVELFWDNEIAPHEKQRLIKAENELWKTRKP